MNVLWIAGGLVLAIAVLALVRSRRRAVGLADFGSVSGQWLMEYRQSEES